ncbi:MAG: bifunctional hydroxymethylpyrimidine kinase/phosphomethylpyrimidine kinase [Mailhella sp.]|nr:bifunctional hydroxymethylpyrimidine kinase/phosphomethylpyrimidine kinase [Mailhella sp.]
MDKPILLINDLPGYGKVALAAMLPILSHMGFQTYNLPTALVSNTLDYGRFEIMETTGYMRGAMRAWEDLGFSFRAVATGFIVSEEQVRLVLDLCRSMTANGAQIFCDPIMGDCGRLYNGLGQSHVDGMRSLVSCADVAVPNYTEACLLTGVHYRGQGPSREDLDGMLQALAAMGAKSAVVTSVPLEGGHCVVGYESSGGRDASDSRRFILPYEEIPVRFPGTGDIFSAVLMGWCLRGKSLKNASARAMRAVRGMIERNVGSQDSFRGIAVEASLDLLDK